MNESMSLLSTPRVLDYLDASRRLRAQNDARELDLLARLALDPDPYGDGHPELDKEWIVEDVALALRMSSAAAAGKLELARHLIRRFPSTLAAMRTGRLDARHAQRLVDATLDLSDELSAEVERRVLPRVESQAPAQFAQSVRRQVAKLDPRTAEQKHTDALSDRRVAFTPVENGMTELWALLPAAAATALESVIQQRAAATRTTDAAAGVTRTADQRRADALTELATGELGLRPKVNVVVPLSTVLGLDDEPGELAGYGPITAAAARAIACDPTGRWRRLLTDTNGKLVDASSPTYRPPAPMQRFVELRDGTCRFPTCGRRAVNCEIDHVIPWMSGGSTTPANLIPLCPRHHHLKHDGRWSVDRDADGTVRWTSPTGHSYERPPPEAPAA